MHRHHAEDSYALTGVHSDTRSHEASLAGLLAARKGAAALSFLAGVGVSVRYKQAKQSKAKAKQKPSKQARPSKQGKARQGKAKQGKAKQARKAKQANQARKESKQASRAGQGRARQGKARQSKASKKASQSTILGIKVQTKKKIDERLVNKVSVEIS